jgi:hypothetical protein
MFLSELGANHKDLHRFNKKLHGGETDKDQHTEMAARIITELLPSLLARGVIRQEVLEEWNYPMDRITRAASFLRTELEKEEDEHENS